jgi:uncharacterized protein involved in exopolysaccharide biosynthesis
MAQTVGTGVVSLVRAERRDLDLFTALAAVLEGWRAVALAVGLVGTGVAVLLLLQPRQYEAAMTVSTVSNGALSPTGLAASLLGGGAQGGLQPTPPLVVELVNLPGVLRDVAQSRVDTNLSDRIIDRVARASGADSVPSDRIPDVMRGLIKAAIQRETGTITLRVIHRDSALARVVGQRVVTEVRRAFVSAARAQASQLRRAQELRVDSASTQLADAERTLVAFLARNRSVTPFSPTAVEHDRLQRAVRVAEQVYLQAVTDRGAAVAQELQETPVLVVIDPLPSRLPAVPRHRVLKLALAVVLAALMVAFVLVFRESLQPRGAGESDALLRLRAAVQALPLVPNRLVQGPTAGGSRTRVENLPRQP